MKKLWFVDVLYVASVVGANVVVGMFGKEASVLVPLIFLAVTMLTRDVLHQYRNRLYMVGLIVIGSVLSYTLNTSFLPIALASCIAFAVSEMIDYISFSSITSSNWYVKAGVSSLVASVIDSLLFVSIAFGFDSGIIVGQVITKSIGILWTLGVYYVIQSKHNT